MHHNLMKAVHRLDEVIEEGEFAGANSCEEALSYLKKWEKKLKSSKKKFIEEEKQHLESKLRGLQHRFENDWTRKRWESASLLSAKKTEN